MQGREFPFATAHNRGVAAASGAAVVFLNVNCVPTPALVAESERGFSELDRLVMGEMLHLAEPYGRYLYREITQHRQR